MSYAKCASQLQRHLAFRSKQISLAEFQRAAFIYLRYRKDVKAVNIELKELRSRQKLDKALLKLAHAAATEYDWYYGESTTWLGDR